MHGAATPLMPGWPPKTPHELYLPGFQGLKPLTSVTCSVPSFSLADRTVTHQESTVPTGWTNGYKPPLGMGPQGSPFHGEVGLSKEQPRQSPVCQPLEQNHHEIQQQHSSTNIQGSNNHIGYYYKVNEASKFGFNGQIQRNFHSNILNGYSSCTSNFRSSNQDPHSETKLGDQSTVFHFQDSVSSSHGRLTPYEEPGATYSKSYRDESQLRNSSPSPSVALSKGQQRGTDGTVTSKPMDRYHLVDVGSSRFMPHISAAGHPLSTSDSLKTVNSIGTSQSMISHPHPSDKLSQPNSFLLQKDPAMASLKPNHKASKIAAEIFAEAQSSMLQTKTGNMLPSFSNISNMVSYKKPQQGNPPFDSENVGKVLVDSRPENNLYQNNFQNNSNAFQNEPLSNSFWSQFSGVAPNISLDNKTTSQRKSSCLNPNGEVGDSGQQGSETKNSSGQRYPQNKSLENTKPPRTIKDMVEEKRTEKHKKKNTHEDPNISKLVDAKVQEILAAYKEKERQRHQNLVKPKESKPPPKNMALKESHLETIHVNASKSPEYSRSVLMSKSAENGDNGAHEMDISRQILTENEKLGQNTLTLQQQVMDMRKNRRESLTKWEESLDKREAQRPQSIFHESPNTNFAQYQQGYERERYTQNTSNLHQQVMDMRMNRKETLDKSDEDRPCSVSDQRQNITYADYPTQQNYISEKSDDGTHGLHEQPIDMRAQSNTDGSQMRPQNNTDRSQADMLQDGIQLTQHLENPQHHNFPRPSSTGKHSDFDEKVNMARYWKKQFKDHPQELPFGSHQHFSYHPSQLYYQQGWQHGHALKQQVDEMRAVKREQRFSGEHKTNESEFLAGRKTPCCGNCKEVGMNFSENCVNHKSHESSQKISGSINNGLNLSVKKDPYEFDALDEKIGPNLKMISPEFMHYNGFSSMQGHPQKHFSSKLKVGTGLKNFNRMELPYNKPSQGLYFSKKIGSKHLGYKTSLSLLKKSHKYNSKYTGKLPVPGKKTRKPNHSLVHPTAKPSGKIKTKDKFAENLMKNLGFPPLSKSDLKSLSAPKFKMKFMNGHFTKDVIFKKEPNLVPGISNNDQKHVPMNNIDTYRVSEKGSRLNGEIKKPLDLCSRQTKVKGLLPRSKSVDSALASSCESTPLQKSRSLSLNDVRESGQPETTCRKAENVIDNLQDKGPMDASKIEVENITNHVTDLKRMVTGQLSDYNHQLETNTVVSVPQCGCLGPDHMFNEAVEGPYYTHLGAGRSVEAIRLLLENRTGTEGRAIRIEKLRYTGKEGKSSQGCPIAKWIVRRSSSDEKYLALVRHRPGHFCDTAWLVIGLVAWEGVPTNQADDLYSYLTEALPDNGLETERRCGTNDRKTCACQGIDLKKRGASFSFGCSWSMYFNGCKFARSQVARKFRLKSIEQEPKLEEKLQNLATHLAPLYKQCAPQAHYNQCYFSERAQDCRLGHEKPGPFSGVTACADFCAHAHKDIHNMNNGSTVVVTLTKHRGLSKPDDEQLHVLPLYVLEPTDEKGSYDAQYDKIQNGALEVLHHYPLEARVRSQPLESCRKRRLNKKSPGKKKGSPGKNGLAQWNGSSSSNQSTPKKAMMKREMALWDSPASNRSFSSQYGSGAGTPMKQPSHPNIGEGLKPTCPDPTKMKHPGFEAFYEKFMDYFEANGSFPPPAFMAQYARARQMLLNSGGEMGTLNKSLDHVEGQTKFGAYSQPTETKRSTESSSGIVIGSHYMPHANVEGHTNFGADTQSRRANEVTKSLNREENANSSVYEHGDIILKRQQASDRHENDCNRHQQICKPENSVWFNKDCISASPGNVPISGRSDYIDSYNSMSHGTGVSGSSQGSTTALSFTKSDSPLIHQNSNAVNTSIEPCRSQSQDFVANLSVPIQNSSEVARSAEHSRETVKSVERSLETVRSTKHSALAIRTMEEPSVAIRSAECSTLSVRSAGDPVQKARSAFISQDSDRHKEDPVAVINPFSDYISFHQRVPAHGSVSRNSCQEQCPLPDRTDKINFHKPASPHGNFIVKLRQEQHSQPCSDDNSNPHKPVSPHGNVITKSSQDHCSALHNNDSINPHNQGPPHGSVIMRSMEPQPLPNNIDYNPHKAAPPHCTDTTKSGQEQCSLSNNNGNISPYTPVPPHHSVTFKSSLEQGPPLDNIQLSQQGSIERPQVSAMDLSSATSSKGSVNEQGPQSLIHPLNLPSYQGEHFGSSNQQGQHSITKQSPLDLLSDSASALKEESNPKNEPSPLNLSRNGLQVTDSFTVGVKQGAENISNKAATPYPHVSNGQFYGQTYLQTPSQPVNKIESQNVCSFNSANIQGQGHFDSERNDYHSFHSNEQRRSQISWNMFNYSPQKSPSHQYPSAMTTGQFPKTEITSESSIDPNIVKCSMEYNEEAFRDPNIGGVAVALNHGAVLFEVAKRELHATTGLKNPNRFRPTRISLVFYQHKNLNNERHGMYAYAKKLENMKLERIAKMKEQRGFVDMEEIENSFKGGKKRKLEDMKSPEEEEYDIMKTSAVQYRYMLECHAKRQESFTTNSYSTKWVKPQPMVTGPYQKWV